jgi:hypothetical protein
MIVRHRVKVPKAPEAMPAVPVKKVVVVKKVPVSASASPNGLRRVVLKKKPALASYSAGSDEEVGFTYQYKDEVEVVRPSKKSFRRDDRPRQSDRAPLSDPHMVSSGSSIGGGGTFADLIKASQERYRNDKNKKRR